MRIVDPKVVTKDFDDWCSGHGLDIIVTRRTWVAPPSLHVGEWYATFSHPVDIRFENKFTRPSGDGENPDMAIWDLACKISGRVVVFDAFSSHANTMIAPTFTVRSCEQVEKDRG